MPNLCIHMCRALKHSKYAQPLYTHVSSTQTFKICPTSIYTCVEHSNIQNMPNLYIHMCRALKHSKYAQPLYTHVSSTQTFKICPTSIYTCVEHSNIQICPTSIYACVACMYDACPFLTNGKHALGVNMLKGTSYMCSVTACSVLGTMLCEGFKSAVILKEMR